MKHNLGEEADTDVGTFELIRFKEVYRSVVLAIGFLLFGCSSVPSSNIHYVRVEMC